MGCEPQTGLGIPQGQNVFAAYDIPIDADQAWMQSDAEFLKLFNAPGPAAFMVHIDPMQAHFSRRFRVV